MTKKKRKIPRKERPILGISNRNLSKGDVVFCGDIEFGQITVIEYCQNCGHILT